MAYSGAMRTSRLVILGIQAATWVLPGVGCGKLDKDWQAEQRQKAAAESRAKGEGATFDASAERDALSGQARADRREGAADSDTVEAGLRPTATGEPMSYRQRVKAGAIGSRMLLVDGEAITIEDILDPIMSELQEKAKTLSPREYAEFVQRLVAEQIWQQVNERLVYREAIAQLDDRMLEVLDREVDRFIRQRVTEEFGGLQSRFERHLADLGRTMDDVREQTKRHLLVVDYLRRKFVDRVPEPTRSELWDYYQAHLEEFTTPSSTELFLIDIPYDAFAENRRSRPGSEDWLRSKIKAQEQADKALAELDSGMDFEAVARTYSKGIHAADGGAWGVIGPSGLVGRYRMVTETLKGMSAYQHSGVVEGEDAYLIVGTGYAMPQQVVSFEHAQPQIKVALRQQRLAEMEREYLSRLSEHATVQRWQEFRLEVLQSVPQPQASPADDDTARSGR
jgi:hypothetical protein